MKRPKIRISTMLLLLVVAALTFAFMMSAQRAAWHQAVLQARLAQTQHAEAVARLREQGARLHTEHQSKSGQTPVADREAKSEH